MSETLGTLLRARGLQGRLSEYRILGTWEKTVGSLIASHARPVSVRGGKLFLAVDSPAWMQQLSLLKPEIIEKVNRSLQKESVRDIVLNLGEIAPAAPPDQAQPQLTLGDEDRRLIERSIAPVNDPDVRQALRRVIEKDLLSKRRSTK